MPSYRSPGIQGEFAFMNKCGIILQFTHIPSGRVARFIGALTDYKDAFSSEWNSEPVYGRMDPIPTFKNTGRLISISWTILNESAQIGKDNMREVTKLINFLYPNYLESNDATTISTAPLLRLEFTNIANDSKGQGLVGYLNGFTYDPVIDAGWVKQSGSELIAQELRASVQFTVLHTDNLGWEKLDPRTKGFPYGYDLGTQNEAPASSGDNTPTDQERFLRAPGGATPTDLPVVKTQDADKARITEKKGVAAAEVENKNMEEINGSAGEKMLEGR